MGKKRLEVKKKKKSLEKIQRKKAEGLTMLSPARNRETPRKGPWQEVPTAPKWSCSSSEWILALPSSYSAQYSRSQNQKFWLTILGLCDAKKDLARGTPSIPVVKEANWVYTSSKSTHTWKRYISQRKVNAIRGNENGCYVSPKMMEVHYNIKFMVHVRTP